MCIQIMIFDFLLLECIHLSQIDDQGLSSLSLYLYFLATMENRMKPIRAKTQVSRRKPKPQLVTGGCSLKCSLSHSEFSEKGSVAITLTNRKSVLIVRKSPTIRPFIECGLWAAMNS